MIEYVVITENFRTILTKNMKLKHPETCMYNRKEIFCYKKSAWRDEEASKRK